MSTRTETELIDSAGGARSEPGGERTDLAALRARRKARLRSGRRAMFATVLLTR